MNAKQTKIKITEIFKNEDIDKRKETVEKLFYKIIETQEFNKRGV